jgi:hypothetical protein
VFVKGGGDWKAAAVMDQMVQGALVTGDTRASLLAWEHWRHDFYPPPSPLPRRVFTLVGEGNDEVFLQKLVHEKDRLEVNKIRMMVVIIIMMLMIMMIIIIMMMCW